MGSFRNISPERVSSDPADRVLYSRDMMPGALIDEMSGKKLSPPDLVCWPEDNREIVEILKWATARRIPVIPFGGGSGVAGGTTPVAGGMIIDLKKMNRLGRVQERGGRYAVVAQSGILGQHLEDQLNVQGFTLGHFPSSIFWATLGGYLACRSAGQLSSKYGKIEDMTEAIEVILPNGRIVPMDGKVPGWLHADPRDLFLGTEGCLGIITRARLRIHPLPPAARYRGVNFNRLEDALAAMRRILQAGLRPSVVRLYDPIDSLLLEHGYKATDGEILLHAPSGPQNGPSPPTSGGVPPETPSKGIESGSAETFSVASQLLNPISKLSEWLQEKGHQWLLQYLFPLQGVLEKIVPHLLLILGFEGDPALIEAQEREALAICNQSICRDLGEEPGIHWLRHRYSVSYKMPQIFEMGGFVDTVEVATTWTKLPGLYQKMKRSLARHALVLAHFSHAYPEGCSIYFTFVGRTGARKKDRLLYDRIWNDAMEACLEAGGTISHHHGIGLLKAKFLPRELGGAMDFYREIKRDLDPKNIMNPGKMGLDASY